MIGDYRSCVVTSIPAPRQARKAVSAFLSPDELQYYASCRYPKRRQEWFSGRLAAKEAVRRFLRRRRICATTPGNIEIIAGSNGVPSWRLRTRVVSQSMRSQDAALSIAHSGAMAVAICGGGQGIGIDIERLRPVSDAMQRYFLSAEEQAAARQILPRQKGGAIIFWTVKEAVLKAAGIGLRVPLLRFRVEVLHSAMVSFRIIDRRGMYGSFFARSFLRDGYGITVAGYTANLLVTPLCCHSAPGIGDL